MRPYKPTNLLKIGNRDNGLQHRVLNGVLASPHKQSLPFSQSISGCTAQNAHVANWKLKKSTFFSAKHYVKNYTSTGFK